MQIVVSKPTSYPTSFKTISHAETYSFSDLKISCVIFEHLPSLLTTIGIFGTLQIEQVTQIPNMESRPNLNWRSQHQIVMNFDRNSYFETIEVWSFTYAIAT